MIFYLTDFSFHGNDSGDSLFRILIGTSYEFCLSWHPWPFNSKTQIKFKQFKKRKVNLIISGRENQPVADKFNNEHKSKYSILSAFLIKKNYRY